MMNGADNGTKSSTGKVPKNPVKSALNILLSMKTTTLKRANLMPMESKRRSSKFILRLFHNANVKSMENGLVLKINGMILILNWPTKIIRI